MEGFEPLEAQKRDKLVKLGKNGVLWTMGKNWGNETDSGDGRRRGGAIVVWWRIWVVGIYDLSI